MPIPYPEAFSAGGHLDAKSGLMRLVSLQVVVFDWYILGMPAAVPGWLRLGASLSSRQWSVVKR